jgi:hypothetical protein
MEYSKSYFGKSLEELLYEDIENFFIIEKEESDKIEFKAYSLQYGNISKNLDGVIRGICAFLNSEGGILIWGAPEGSLVDGRKEKIFKGALSPVSELIEKDSLINKISDSITPLPTRVNVKILNKQDLYLYVFEIQTSDYKPHQFKNTYYARLDGQTKPAPHYLIESLFKQIKFPNIEGYIKPTKISHNGLSYYLDIEIYLFNFTHLQNEEKPFFRLMSSKGTFVRAREPQYADMYNYDGHLLIYENRIDFLHFGAPNCHSEKIQFSPHETEVTLILMFGGKKSPLKTSMYTLDLSEIDWNNTDNPNYLFKEINENKMNSDGQAELNISKTEMLTEMLGR